MQSKMLSLIEAVVNFVASFFVAMVLQYILFPFFGFYPSFSENVVIFTVFSIASLIRSYYIRRFFNHYHNSFSSFLMKDL